MASYGDAAACGGSLNSKPQRLSGYPSHGRICKLTPFINAKRVGLGALGPGLWLALEVWSIINVQDGGNRIQVTTTLHKTVVFNFAVQLCKNLVCLHILDDILCFRRGREVQAEEHLCGTATFRMMTTHENTMNSNTIAWIVDDYASRMMLKQRICLIDYIVKWSPLVDWSSCCIYMFAQQPEATSVQ